MCTMFRKFNLRKNLIIDARTIQKFMQLLVSVPFDGRTYIMVSNILVIVISLVKVI